MKKSEMVRRTKLVKWVQFQTELYERMANKDNSDSMYMAGFSDTLNDFCKKFGIEADEQRKG